MPRSSKPDLEPSVDLEEPAMTVTNARATSSWARSLGRAVSWAGGHAMRPQSAMAAVLLLMLGSSLFFLRARPEQGSSARIKIIERGIPDRRDEGGHALPPHSLAAADLQLVQERAHDMEPGRTEPVVLVRGSSASPASRAQPLVVADVMAGSEESEGVTKRVEAPPSEAALPAGAPSLEDAGPSSPLKEGDPYEIATALYKSGQFAEAARRFDTIASSSARNAPMAALFAAKSIERGSGCGAALSRYEAVASHFANTSVAGDALWGAASCYKELGQFGEARELYLKLRQIAGYRDRAEQEIATLDTILAGAKAGR